MDLGARAVRGRGPDADESAEGQRGDDGGGARVAGRRDDDAQLVVVEKLLTRAKYSEVVVTRRFDVNTSLTVSVARPPHPTAFVVQTNAPCAGAPFGGWGTRRLRRLMRRPRRSLLRLHALTLAAPGGCAFGELKHLLPRVRRGRVILTCGHVAGSLLPGRPVGVRSSARVDLRLAPQACFALGEKGREPLAACRIFCRALLFHAGLASLVGDPR